MAHPFARKVLLLAAATILVAFQVKNDELSDSIKRGQGVYTANCLSCHQADGAGVPGVYPPLAKSDYLMADAKRAITIVLKGLEGEIAVNGETYSEAMPSQSHLTDGQVADVLNYIRNSWGNTGTAVTAAQIKAER